MSFPHHIPTLRTGILHSNMYCILTQRSVQGEYRDNLVSNQKAQIKSPQLYHVKYQLLEVLAIGYLNASWKSIMGLSSGHTTKPSTLVK